MKIDLKTMIAILILVSGIVSSHYIGLATAREYTDKKSEEIAKEDKEKDKIQTIKYDKIIEKVETVGHSLVKLQTSLEYISKKVEKL